MPTENTGPVRGQILLSGEGRAVRVPSAGGQVTMKAEGSRSTSSGTCRLSVRPWKGKKVLVALIPIMIVVPMLLGSPRVATASTMRLTAQLRGSSEVGAPGAPNGKGTAAITVNMSTDKLCYTLKVSGFKLPAIAAHIHAGHAGKNGPIVVPFPRFPGKNGKASGCTTVRASLLKAITGHPSSYYVNVHTTQYPGGAVRGQIM